VPVVMVTGDDVAVRQVRETAKDARGVEVKRAINIRAVELVPLGRARQEIETAARESVQTAPRRTASRAPEYRVTMRFRNFVIPEIATAFEGVERPAPDTVSFTRKTMPEAYRLIRVLYRYIDVN
jgi:D-amino peptidase